jgi:hypothetical protein
MATNASSLVNFGTTGPAVGEFIYAIGPRSAPSFLPADNATTSYLNSSYPALAALINTPATSFSFTTPTLFNTNWPGIAYGNGTFVATSQNTNTRSATSSDGTTWTVRNNLPTGNWIALGFGAGVFVTINYNTAAAATSTDGVTWTNQGMSATANWYAVTFGAGVFVAVAYNSTVASTSPNGVTWTARTLPSARNWGQVVFGNSLFMAVASDTATYATSTDGITWTQRTFPASLTNCSVGFGNGKFVALAGNVMAGTSTDGVSWDLKPVANIAGGAIAYGNGLYVAASYSGYAATSVNGLDWIQWYVGVPNILNIAHGPAGVFVAVNGGGGSLVARITPSTSASSFQIPVISPITGTTAYVKAT